MITNDVVRQLFAEHGLRFVEDASIPQSLKEKGWKVQIYQKEVKNNLWPWSDLEMIVMHLIFGPDNQGKSVCLGEDIMVIKFTKIKRNDGIEESRIKNVRIERSTSASKCVEFFQAL